MTIAIALLNNSDLVSLTAWAARIARAYDEDLLILDATTAGAGEQTRWVEPGAENASSPIGAAISALPLTEFQHTAQLDSKSNSSPAADATSGCRRLALLEIRHREPAEAILDAVATEAVSLLIVPRHQSDRSTSIEFAVQRRLFRDAPCMAVQLRPASADAPPVLESLLVAAGGGPHTSATLQLAERLADRAEAHLAAMYVEPNVDDVADLVGHEILDRIVRRALKSKADGVEQRVVLSSSASEAIRTEARHGCDLLLLGATHHGVVHRLLFSSLSEEILSKLDGAAVAVVRPAITLPSKFLRRLEYTLHARVPQLDRQARVRLVERVQSSSTWDFDFMALICLSTFIAALGLLQNSAAVVIGAMLVAPLMTPLLGAGLSLVQGNVLLLRNSAGAVARGFLFAFVIGLACGLIMPSNGITNEIAARGSPRIADLLVAFVSGIAAAYAMGRPNLVSALPGVAIAAALVPPVATVGLAISFGHWEIAIGALLLFLTNIVAIILGAACSLFATGIRGSHGHGRFASWVPRVAVALVSIAIGLAVYETLPQQDLAPTLQQALAERIDREDEFEFIAAVAEQRGEQRRIHLTIAGTREPHESLLHDLMRVVREHGDTAHQLRIETQSTTIGNWDDDQPTSIHPPSGS